MPLADQHMHSTCSFDAQDTMAVMAAAARNRGMSAVCFTDHVDMDHAQTGSFAPNYPACWPPMAESAARIRENPLPGIDVRCGIELGCPHHAPELAREIAGLPGLDFVLGSLHNLRQVPDFYFLPYESQRHCNELNRLYLNELLELAELDCFDVMAHVGYTARYMDKAGFDGQLTPEKHGDTLTTLFQRLIYRGKGIECNTSGLRQYSTTYPDVWALQLYRQLGGEIITVGSDAHRAQDAGADVENCYTLLRELGFVYVTEFKNRTPHFVKL